mgnify:CR=1 FL=1
MSLIIGSARIDENGRAYGGANGDQTGREVSTQPFYVHSKGWDVLRAKSVSHANKLADRMLAACNNNNIGYNQSNRLGVIKYGINTTTKTACDCSSLVRECVIEACGVDAGNFVTSTELAALQATGLFDVFSYKNGDTLYNGDILVTKTKGHTVIVVSGNPRKSNNKSYEEIAREVIDGLWGNGDERKSRIEAAGYNYAEVQSRVNTLLNSYAKPTVPVIEYYTKYSGGSGSIVEALNSIGVDSSYSNRKSIAIKNGITGYKGTAAQNTKLLSLLKQGKLRK